MRYWTALTLALLTIGCGQADAAPIATDVRLNMPAPRADVTVHTDGVPRHWRKWQVESADRLDRSERCQARIDARRALRGKRPTQGVPKRCLSRWQQTVKPDPSP